MLLDGNRKQFENHDLMLVFTCSTGELVRTSESTDSVKCGSCYITAGSPLQDDHSVMY